MGFTYVRLGIANAKDGRYSYYKALVDTGSTAIVVPIRIARRLKLQQIDTEIVDTGNGPILTPVATAKVSLMGKERHVDIWINDKVDGVLVGVVALEILGFAVDSKRGKLVEARRILYNIE